MGSWLLATPSIAVKRFLKEIYGAYRYYYSCLCVGSCNEP